MRHRMLHQLARFVSVTPLIEEIAPGTLLEVGSGGEGIAGWLGEGWSVTALDNSFDDSGAMAGPGRPPDRQIVGDARELPFADRAVDVVLALDALEHIPPQDRARALGELARVATRRVIVACPTGPTAQAADARLSAGLRSRGMTPATWLAEHELHRFPERDGLWTQLAPHGPVRLTGSENLRWHEWLFRLEFRRPGFRASRAAARLLAAGLAARGAVLGLSRFAVRVVQGPDRPPSYRTIAVLDVS
jgi:hypothetical protein